MFGADWQPAEGTVIDVRFSGQHGTNQVHGEPHFVMDVRPSDGEPFRTEVDELPLMFSFRPRRSARWSSSNATHTERRPGSYALTRPSTRRPLNSKPKPNTKLSCTPTSLPRTTNPNAPDRGMASIGPRGVTAGFGPFRYGP